MRRLTIHLLTFILLLSAKQLSGQSSSESEYSVVRQDEKIVLYERWRDFPGTTTKARDLKIVFSVVTTPEKMLTAILDEKKLKEWQENLDEYKVTPQNDTAWFTYSYYKMPWPLTDQDYFAHYRVLEKNATRIVIKFEPSENKQLAPVREKIDRMPAYGKWTLEKTTTGKTKVTYTITGKPVNIPRAVTDNLVRNNFMKTINALIVTAEK
jgi:hypothetical protein